MIPVLLFYFLVGGAHTQQSSKAIPGVCLGIIPGSFKGLYGVPGIESGLTHM